jgi:TPR repeat protein
MGTEKNETQFSIARLILEACKDDSPAAKFELANLALKGCKEAEILPNPIESRRLLLENASEPTLHGPSQFTLGNQLLNDPIAGDSVSEEDTKRGLTFIKQAALSGVPAACAQMGYLYYNQHDFKKAHEYLILAKSDHPEVLFLLGLCKFPLHF